jgi:DNA-binding NarL/FixJ family response regulator
MSKKVLLIGHCGPDSSYLRMAVHKALPEAQILSAEDNDELQSAIKQGVDLVLVNRVLDYGFPADGGVELMSGFKESHPKLKWMVISNHADAQQAAQSAGALPGFGKRDIGSPKAVSALKHALGN